MIFKSFKPFLSGCLTLTLLHNQEKGRFILSTAVSNVYENKCHKCKATFDYIKSLKNHMKIAHEVSN